MKKLDRYIFFTMLKISSLAMLFITFLLLVVELFINFQRYTSMLPTQTVTLLVLKIPFYLSLVAGPAALFSTTFFISTLYSNNEFISLLSAGVSYRRAIRSILVLSLIYTVFFFGFNEKVKNPADIKYDEKRLEYTNPTAARIQNDSRNITLNDNENGVSVKVNRYIDREQRIDGVHLIVLDKDGNLQKKVFAQSGKWNDSEKRWDLKTASEYIYDVENMNITHTEHENLVVDTFTLTPSFFRNKGEDIRTMKLSQTKEYLQSLKVIKNDVYSEKLTELYIRISQSIIILVMMIASMSMNLQGKRNAMMFSLISSLALAVVYYAINMATTLMAKKGMMNPLLAVMIPIVIIISYSLFMIRRVST